MNASAAPAWSGPPSPLTIARQLHAQLQRDLSHSPIGPARAPEGYLDQSRALLAHLAEQLRLETGPDREDRKLGQNLRHCAIVSRLLAAAADTVEAAVPSRTAWDAARRFLVAAQCTISDLIEGMPGPGPRRLRVIDGGRR